MRTADFRAMYDNEGERDGRWYVNRCFYDECGVYRRTTIADGLSKREALALERIMRKGGR